MTKRLLSCLLTLGLTLAAVIGANIAPAYALVIADYGTIDLNKPVTLTVHKHLTPAGEPGNGLKQETGPSTKPVEGVTFGLHTLMSDRQLFTPAGWKKAAQLAEQFNADHDVKKLIATAFGDGDDLETADSILDDPFPTVTTNAQGEALFNENMAAGLYLVREVDTSQAKVDGQPARVVASRPFVVALPMTHPVDRDKWLYDVHVYPKNTKPEVTKSVDDSRALAVGQDATYTVMTDVPQEADLNKYVVMDKFDPAHLEFKQVSSVKLGETPLEATTDYQVSNSDGLVKVTMTEAGLKKLAANPTAKVTVVFVATVKAVAETDGVITNTAYLVPSTDFSEDPDGPGEDGKIPPIPSDPVKSKFAKVVITKVDALHHDKKLAGAEFKVYPCNTWGYHKDADPLTVGGQTTFTTDEEGTVTIDGLRLSDFEKNKKITADFDHTYCLVETKAPAGYELLTEAVQFTITEDTVTQGIFALEVENVKSNGGFHLPLTGSNAALVLGIGGALLIGGGIVMLARKRARRQ